MAKRPVFTPNINFPFVKEVFFEFKWYPGFSKTQTQKSIASLHNAARMKGINPVLEISSKSPDLLGIEISAFNLMLTYKGKNMSVECAFQGSKIFENGGPFTDLYETTSRDARTDERIRNSGSLTKFNFVGEDFPTKPLTAFYDWLYITALFQNPSLCKNLENYRGFSDIVFNPKKSINCQARSAALFVALKKNGFLNKALDDKRYYFNLVSQKKNPSSNNNVNPEQFSLF